MHETLQQISHSVCALIAGKAENDKTVSGVTIVRPLFSCRILA